MRTYLSLVLLVCSISFAAAQEEFLIQFGDSTMIEIDLDKDYQIDLNGQEITFRVVSKDTLLYDDELFSFKYPKDYRTSKLALDEGIEQVMLMTAEGSGVLIQKYSTINPTMLNEIMINEVTKESISYGFKMERQDYQREIGSGQRLNIGKAVLTYKDETNIYEVASIGSKDEGILIMTMMMDDQISAKGREIIDLMWHSLVFKMKK